MLHFTRAQEVVQIGGVTFGGQPGEYPTVLMGALFYSGDRLLAEPDSAEFDRAAAGALVQQALTSCRAVGVPLVLDLVCATPAQARAFVGFGLEVSDQPILIDGTTPEVRLAGLREAAERQAQDRVIFNSVSSGVSDDELRLAVGLGCRSAVIMLVNSRNPTVRGKLAAAREQVPRAYRLGFENLLLDLAVLDIVDVGTCAATIPRLKEEFGLPCGCSPTHTHKERWIKAKMFSPAAQAAARVSCATMLQSAGASFFMYDLKQIEVIPAMAMVDAEIAYAAREWQVRPQTPEHPLLRVFR